jgi:hypothetical protein
MGAPLPELVDVWLAKAFNAHEVEAAAAMYHPDASVVRLDHAHGTDAVARDATGIRETMVGYIGLKPPIELTGNPLGRRVAAVTHQLVRCEAASGGAALVARAGGLSAKEASHA